MPTVETSVLAVLSSGEVEGSVFRITGGQLDRKLYEGVNNVLETLGGKWNRKLKGHVFDSDPAELIDNVILTGEIGKKNPLEFFETPAWLAKHMVELADIEPNMRVLEPSAGKGAIVDAIILHSPIQKMEDITAIEQNAAFIPALEELGCNVVCADFLEWQPDGYYQRVVLNPPFSRGQDVAHIMRAYEVLASGGRLVAIMSAGIGFRQDEKYRELRKLIEQHGRIISNPEGTFKDSGTGVNTVTVVIDKP